MLSERITAAADDLRGLCLDEKPMSIDDMWRLLTHLQYWRSLALKLEGHGEVSARPEDFTPAVVGGTDHQTSPEATPETGVVEDAK